MGRFPFGSSKFMGINRLRRLQMSETYFRVLNFAGSIHLLQIVLHRSTSLIGPRLRNVLPVVSFVVFNVYGVLYSPRGDIVIAHDRHDFCLYI